MNRSRSSNMEQPQRSDSMSAFLSARKMKESRTPFQQSDLKSRYSPMQVERRQWNPTLPDTLTRPVKTVVDSTVKPCVADSEALAKQFPATWGQTFVKLEAAADGTWPTGDAPAMRIGVVLSGGQAAGGHNVIAGIFDYVKQISRQSQLFGFLLGPHGIYSHNYREISDEFMDEYRNMGGFDMIGSGRHKIETEEQKSKAMEICHNLDLHGLVIIGGDDSNTNAAILAEYFKAHGSKTNVIGCPKTIDGDLRNEYVEASFGFDTACKTYAELIGNLCTDAATSQDRYHFIRLMGRSASHITMECALQTRPNMTFIGEEIQQHNRSVKDLVAEIVEMVTKRHAMKKHFGVVLLPEGLVEFIPEIGKLIQEINDIVAAGPFDKTKLTPESLDVFNSLPSSVAQTLLLDRDPHGNVQVSKIATEQLLVNMVEAELISRGVVKSFIYNCHFFGYEGRCPMPSNFDANYCYALGHTAGALVANGVTGYMAVVRHLRQPVESWAPGGCPMTIMMNLERRKGKDVPVIKKFLVEMDNSNFKAFCDVREHWKYSDLYRNPGPIQFEGPHADCTNFTLALPCRDDLLPEAPTSKCWFAQSAQVLSPVQRQRLQYHPEINPMLKKTKARAMPSKKTNFEDQQSERFVHRAFPLQCDKHQYMSYNVELDEHSFGASYKIGVVLGGQAVPGANNVVHGLFERCQLAGGQLVGFKGLAGLMNNDHVMVDRDDIQMYINQGGFEMLGRTPSSKILMRTREGIDAVAKTALLHKLDGLVIIGGQTSLTDAAVVTEHFLSHGIDCTVVGVPANQENNVRHAMIETAVGFDSTSKCYASLIGNLLTDAASAKKYWYFIRLMGMVPSNIVAEAALSTHPNCVVISERYADRNMGLQDIVMEIADVVERRASAGKNFGSVLIPEGLVTQIPQLKSLINDVDKLLKKTPTAEHSNIRDEFVSMPSAEAETSYLKQLAPWSLALLKTLPEFFRAQLVKQTPSGRVELSEIGSEQLLAELVERELRRRKEEGTYKGSFQCISHYFGFQGRSTIPSNFDCTLGTSHGYLAGILVESRLTGYVTTVRGLCARPAEWKLSGVPISALLRVMPAAETEAYGRSVPMVPCADVDLNGAACQALFSSWGAWESDDCYTNPGPIQFEGSLANAYNRTLYEEQHEYLEMLSELEALTAYVTDVCGFGVAKEILRTSVVSMKGLAAIISDRKKGGKY